MFKKLSLSPEAVSDPDHEILSPIDPKLIKSGGLVFYGEDLPVINSHKATTN